MIVLPKSDAQSDRSRLASSKRTGRRAARPHLMSLVAADLSGLDAEDYPADRVIALPDAIADRIGVQTAEEPDRRDKLPARGSDLARAWLTAHLIREGGVQPSLSGISDIAAPIPPGARSEWCKLYTDRGQFSASREVE